MKNVINNLGVSTTAHRLQELMDYFGVNQTDVANRTGIHRANISSYLAGKRQPAQNNVIKIARAYDVEPAWIIGMDVPMRKTTTPVEDVNVSALATMATDSTAQKLMEYYEKLEDSDKLLLLSLAESLKKKSEKAN